MAETIGVFETESEVQSEEWKKNFVKLYPGLQSEIKNANFTGENFLEYDDFSQSFYPSALKIVPGSSHREVYEYGYKNLILKTPEAFDAGLSLEAQGNLSPNLPIVKYTAAIRDRASNKEYLIEPKGEFLFNQFYSDYKNIMSEQDFLMLIDEFAKKFKAANTVPLEFDYTDLDKHLLVFRERGKWILKITDVDATKELSDAKREYLDNLPSKYISHVKMNEILAKFAQTETAKPDPNIEKQENSKIIIHDIKSVLAAAKMFLQLWSQNKIDQNKLIQMAGSICDNMQFREPLLDRLHANIIGLSNREKLEQYNEFEHKLEANYDNLVKIFADFSLDIKAIDTDKISEAEQLIDKLVENLSESWLYVRNEYNPNKIV